MFKRLITLTLFAVISFSAYATHIVGGAITYVHNGGDSYTVTLTIYKDCEGINIILPVELQIRGYNGATFNPSKDIAWNAAPVLVEIPADVDDCAETPDPIPCVEVPVFEATLDLPPNFGGYHLYYQVEARNAGITNTDAASGRGIGESFYAYIPAESIWSEDFESYADGTTVGSGAPSKWTRTLDAIDPPNYGQVENNLFEFSGEDDAIGTWTSEWIDISTYTNGVNLNVDVSEAGNMDGSDEILIQYSVDNGALTTFSVNGFFNNDFNDATATESTVIGDLVQIVVTETYGGN